MKKDTELELNLNRITVWEEIVRKDTFEEYKKYAVMLLQTKDLYLFEKEVLKACKSDNIEKVLQQYPHILKTGARRKNEDGTFSTKYMDIGTDYCIQTNDFQYDVFFAYKLRQLDLLQIDAFLEYHILHYYDNNLQEFSRFLRICIRKQTTKLLSPGIIQTVNEWVETKEKQQQDLKGTTENLSAKTKKGKVKREAQDKLTCLSQEQTVLLMYYLQQERVLLKDEYLTDMDAGKAFEILTGYSQHSLRQNLSKFNLYQNKTNLKEIDNLLTRLKIAIDKDLKGK